MELGEGVLSMEVTSLAELALRLYGRAYEFLTLQHFERTVYLVFVAYALFCANPTTHIMRVDHFYMFFLLLVSNENLGKRLSKLYQIDLETSFIFLNFMILLLLHPLGIILLRKFVDYFFIMELDKFFINLTKKREQQVEQQAQQEHRLEMPQSRLIEQQIFQNR